jgi:hypothetical protein
VLQEDNKKMFLKSLFYCERSNKELKSHNIPASSEVSFLSLLLLVGETYIILRFSSSHSMVK